MKAVILAGGSGSRLWPLSRSNKPKQFQKLVSNQTMLQDTFDRLNFLQPADIFVSTNVKYAPTVKEQLKNRLPLKNIIIEPYLRDTAPCIGLAAMYLAKKHPHEIMAVIYADHLIQNKNEFIKKLKIAEKLAKTENTLNIIEVKAKYPNVHLGYVKVGKMLKKINDAKIFALERFTEKPNLKLALKFQQSSKYLWNTGLYVWKIDTILKKFKKHLPNTYRQLLQIYKQLDTGNEAKALKTFYPLCDKISIDYGIMEKIATDEVRIIPAELGWSDVGSWESIFEELAVTKKSNLTKARHLGIDSEGSLIYGSDKKLIATIGIKDLIVVATDDALLICKKNRSQEVKKLVEKLKKSTLYKKLI